MSICQLGWFLKYLFLWILTDIKESKRAAWSQEPYSRVCESLQHLCPKVPKTRRILSGRSFNIWAIVCISWWGSLRNSRRHAMMTAMPLLTALQLFLDFWESFLIGIFWQGLLSTCSDHDSPALRFLKLGRSTVTRVSQSEINVRQEALQHNATHQHTTT